MVSVTTLGQGIVGPDGTPSSVGMLAVGRQSGIYCPAGLACLQSAGSQRMARLPTEISSEGGHFCLPLMSAGKVQSIWYKWSVATLSDRPTTEQIKVQYWQKGQHVLAGILNCTKKLPYCIAKWWDVPAYGEDSCSGWGEAKRQLVPGDGEVG